MSGIYLVLRRRLEDVVDWVELGEELMRSSRKARGFSYEAMGRQLNVASKTYERYEKSGRVPRHMLDRVADVLDLELERPERRVVAVENATPPDAQDLQRRMDDQQGAIEALTTAVDLLTAAVEEALLPARRVPARRRRAS